MDMQMQPKLKFEIVVSSEEWEKKTVEAIRGIRLYRRSGRRKDIYL